MTTRSRPRWRTWLRIAGASLVCASVQVVADQRPAAAASSLRGSGSTYVGLAMQNWVNKASALGVRVDYQPVGSPAGLEQFGQGLIDFAGTEAEFSGIVAATGARDQPWDRRGYQYVPDVAGAIAVMYNVEDTAGRKVDYLRLSPRTVARIFTGDITNWSDPAIAADNAAAGLRLPDQPITVVYRSGRSGTTALFYDFVANVASDVFEPWRVRNGFPDNKSARIIELAVQGSATFAPKTYGLNGSDQIAQTIASNNGKWMIGYDEFGYAKVYGTQVARILNPAGQWVLPYAENITAALEAARLRPDLTQELEGVYANPNPMSYPISAYSYLVTQCAPAGDRATCKGPYGDPGVAESLARFMRMIACEGQEDAAALGYSPLPTNLSQEVANSIGRMLGRPAEQLGGHNCSNPRFDGGGLGPGAVAPPDPVERRRGQNQGTDTTGPGAEAGANGSEEGSGSADGSSERAAGIPGRRRGAGEDWLDPDPVAYDRPSGAEQTLWPLLVLVGILIVPTFVAGGWVAWESRMRGLRSPG